MAIKKKIIKFGLDELKKEGDSLLVSFRKAKDEMKFRSHVSTYARRKKIKLKTNKLESHFKVTREN